MLGHARKLDSRARELLAIHDELAACRDLRPGPVVDAAFRRLVRLAVDTDDDMAGALLAQPAVRAVADELRAFSVEGEHQLEAVWAERVAASADPAAEMCRFPFVDNYRQLHAMERDAVRRLADGGAAADRVAVVGSGPLPLTALLLARNGALVDNLDRDPVALAASRQVADALGVGGLGFVAADVGGAPADVDLAPYGLVVLAALAGPTPGEKARALRHLAQGMAPGSVLLVRSARGLRTLLYPEVDPGAVAGIEVLGTVHPEGEVVNSVVVARKPTGR
jgi:nicotianamine synthase